MAVNLDELRAQVEILRWAKERKAEIAEVEKTARAAVEEALGDNDAGTVDGFLVISWKAHKRTALDQKLLKSLYPDVDAECRTTTEVRRFEVS